MTIQQLCVKYGTDKTPEIGHSYAPIYDKYFKGLEVESVMEIGVGSRAMMNKYVEGYEVGASLRVWRDFFPKAQIYGIDNNPDAMLSEERITTYLGDSTDKAWVESMGFPKFDIIIDDGSHITDHQISTAQNFRPLLKPGGLYFIEDVPRPDKLRRHLPEYKLEALIDVRGDRLMLVK